MCPQKVVFLMKDVWMLQSKVVSRMKDALKHPLMVVSRRTCKTHQWMVVLKDVLRHQSKVESMTIIIRGGR
jgi:hypothetical protein